MAAHTGESYNNLLDIIIAHEKKPKYSKPEDMFRYLLINCFFKREVDDNRQFQLFLDKYDLPAGLSELHSLLELDAKKIQKLMEGEDIDRSLTGGIMFSKTYLKHFHPHHLNDFSKLPNEIKVEMRRASIVRSQAIIAGFKKIHDDMEADKKRTILTLIALCLKNINRRTGRPIKNVDIPVADIIKEHIDICDEIFTGSSTQLSVLNDDVVVRDILKVLFIVKSFKELKTLSDLFQEEIERFRVRAELVLSAKK